MKKMKKQRGATIIELIISAGLFITLISLASVSFIQALRTQRIVTNLSASMNDVTFVMEQISREVRVGFSMNGGGGSVDFNNPDGDRIFYKFIGSGIGRCINICASNSAYKIITSPDVEIDNLEFILQGTETSDGESPRVTIIASIIAENQIRVNLQTTISSRILDT